VFVTAEGSIGRAALAWSDRSAGVVERGMCAKGFPRNLGGLVGSTADRGGYRVTNPRPLGGTAPKREQRGSATVVRPREGNEARPEGRQGVGVC